jgi:BlaI family transcriptional regulator, penicillinase repressor
MSSSAPQHAENPATVLSTTSVDFSRAYNCSRQMNPSISEAEAQVMEVLWQQSPRAADEVMQALSARLGWQLSTVKTLLSRLVGKGAVGAMPDGQNHRRYLYAPLMAREDWAAEQSVGLVDRLFAGQLAPLVTHFASQRKLSAEDLAALRHLLKKQRDG